MPSSSPSVHPGPEKPAEATTAAVDDDHLQAAVKAALEGFLPRIIHKVSNLMGGDMVSNKFPRSPPPPAAAEEGAAARRTGESDQSPVTLSPGVRLPTAHWLRLTGPRPWRWWQGKQTRFFQAHRQGGGHPQPMTQ